MLSYVANFPANILVAEKVKKNCVFPTTFLVVENLIENQLFSSVFIV